MIQLEEAASAVEEADEVQHRTILVQVQLDDTCCGESISDASALTGPKMLKCHVVKVHVTPLEDRQHTSYQNIERMPNSHDYL
mgnify:CR=1 FL=1